MQKEHVLAEWTRARKALRAASILLEDGLFEDAVSRSYYAVMHAAKSALLAQDTIAESHAAVRRLFGAVLVRSGPIEKEWAAIFAREQDQRIVADYDVEVEWEEEAVQHLVEDSRSFVQRIGDYLTDVTIQFCSGVTTRSFFGLRC
jgi:uncharacterized protein (UPF0332 family)